MKTRGLKKAKGIVAVMLAVVLLICPMTFCHAETSGDFQYQVVGNTVTVTGYTGASSVLIVPGIIDGKAVTAIGSGAFASAGTVTQLTVPATVTSIAADAFASTLTTLCGATGSSVAAYAADKGIAFNATVFGNKYDSLMMKKIPLKMSQEMPVSFSSAISYASSDSSVLVVNNGYVRAKSEGAATLTMADTQGNSMVWNITIRDVFKKGDLTGDNTVDISDLVRMARTVAGISPLLIASPEVGKLTNNADIGVADLVVAAKHVIGVQILTDTVRSDDSIGDNMIMAAEQRSRSVIVYDLDKSTSLDSAEVWRYTPTSGAYVNCSGIKLRYSEFYGCYVMATTSSGGYSCVVAYPTGELLWETTKTAGNPHSIEVLPNGNTLIASSDGTQVRLYNSSIGDTSFVSVTLAGAHGVLYDPSYNTVWALGTYELVKLNIGGTADAPTMSIGTRYTLPSTGGHDLAACFGDVNKLWLTNSSRVMLFDKTTGTFSTGLQKSNAEITKCKGVGNFMGQDKAVYIYPNGTYQSWCTNKIYTKGVSSDAGYTEYTSANGAFYKVRVFRPEYQ